MFAMLQRRYRHGFRPTPRAFAQTVRLSRRSGSRGHLDVWVTGPMIVRLHSTARITITGRGRLSVGSGGTKNVYDGGVARGVLYLGKDAHLIIDGSARLGFGSIVRLGEGATLRLGDGFTANGLTRVLVGSTVTIGKGTVLGTGATVADSVDHATSGDDGETWTDPVAPVTIGDGCWLGAESLVLRGVTVGDGAIVAARAVVTHDVPPATLAAGVPARVVKEHVAWQP